MMPHRLLYYHASIGRQKPFRVIPQGNEMDISAPPSHSLAASITREASKQTYYTIRLFVDRERTGDAYRAYAYFRWVDDRLDSASYSVDEKLAFLSRQQAILSVCYRGLSPADPTPEEHMLVDLVANNPDRNSGLEMYLRNMMAVMAFDVERHGRLISKAELSEYSRLLATAVTEALHYFIGHKCTTPKSSTRYLAVHAAHIIHMLRDWQEDVHTGYFNIPDDYVQTQELDLADVDHPALRDWVRSRVHLARTYFQRGREYTARVKNFRCRLAGYVYIARFEWMLHTIEKDGYRLRAAYPERKSWQAGLWMLARALSSALHMRWLKFEPGKGVSQTI